MFRPLIDPADLGEDTVVSRAAHIGAVEVDDCLVLVDEAAGQTHALNPTASVVWNCLEQPTQLGSLIDDFQAVYGTTRVVIARDVTMLVRDFGSMGLLDGVGRSIESVPINIEFASPQDCAHDNSDARPAPEFDDRYLAAPPNG